MRSWPCSLPRVRLASLLVGGIVLVGCGGPPVTGPEEVDWQLERLASGPVAGEGERAPSLRLEREGQRAFGSGGCNRFTGGFVREGESLRFTPLASTKMACPDMETEAAYFAALDATRAWRLTDGRLELLDEAGASVATFEPAPAAPAPAP